ncbi:lysine--tRNA ligase [Candidatus Nomurabacteria bacterium RIFCSPLOWO2_02_40_28]|uniref:Lysine--tRNA ligase n=2 Tax=Candidatus Nomuraibacteriota TaxID=1752729 RepID=A0A837HUY7_9BACT|nr:MAG: lysyl-tRNA synthetase [Candidatus Nomurabacteria bacterium GW2011_GWD2_39_12]KKR21013.1 MAG: lysyl-tRNA synthetase [Candidatus Nomurabacteria bacterium GW2011_GWC2_39_41]KKR37016.1 MAG: lysyl-tRNA synthetase [Candidatus Nomurabacteria bacterium GW2011_GWE2_40_10]KKR38962.1 MAG: lysyl-tRNA synthetase [Candidatus Nomurabacteria bacterium GW2011_GWB1_40_11]KKR40204.1 MAG: lysyl-tRNA synthetase [Parcubacteria group bacterium GW2011_GWC1_40_11]KKR59349.1 MAG: lysyl-tRNA synthetase [Candidat
MSSIDEIRDTRIKKLELLKSKGVNPYPAESSRELALHEATLNFDTLEKNKEIKWIAGRVMSIRGQGAIIFITLNDGTGTFQGLLKKDVLGGEKFNFFNEVVDIGDFVEIQGNFFTTKRGEKTLEATDWHMLSKSLKPLPEKWHGLQDYETRFRQRYLDILFNPEAKEIVRKKALFWNAVREFHLKNGFLEVETPVLEITTGGADATPFKTHHNALDLDVYLRISAGELWQKKLMVAGIPKTFEIGRIFRNEGMSPEHLQDYTQCEAYWAYANYEDMYKFLQKCYRYVAQETFGTLKFKINGFDVDLALEWPLIDYTKEIEKQLKINIEKADQKEIEIKLKELGVDYEADNKARLIDSLWKHCRKNIGGPAILVNEPKITSPLSKSSPDNPDVTERFHFIIAGSEVGQGYSELNDPIDQLERFRDQEKLREAGDTEAQMTDHDFVEALEYGMPPTAGHGFSERLFSFLMDKPIRETQIFPLMKPIDDEKNKIKEMYVATAIVNSGAGLEPWQIMNTVAHLSAAFGARSQKKLFKFDSIKTKDDKNIKLNIQHAIMIKTADSSDAIWALSDKAQGEGLEIAHFTREMIETTNDKKVAEQTQMKSQKDIDFLGLLIFGPKSKVDALTKDLKLFS